MYGHTLLIWLDVAINVAIYITQNITKHLTSNFRGYTNLCKAHTVMLKVAADINETQRLYEASIRIQVSTCVYAYVGTCVLMYVLMYICTVNTYVSCIWHFYVNN